VVAEVELGFDLGMFDDRINVEATYFNKQSKDGLVTRSLPPSLGAATTITDNLGKVSNIGTELAFDVDAVRSRNFSWNFRLSGSHIKNKIVDRGGVPVGFGLNRSAEGYPIGGFWAQKIRSYDDANSDGILVPSEVVVDTAWSFVGPSLPVLETSLSNTIGFFDNKVSFTALLDFKGGHYHHWGAERDRCTAGNCRAVNDPTASLQEQAYALASSTASLRNSQDGYIVQGDYLRFREASVAFRLPQSWMKHTGTRDATLVLTGRNISTLSTKYPGLDPEAGGQAQETNWAPPPLRYWIAKFNFSF